MKVIILSFLLIASFSASSAQGVRLKDLVTFGGVRTNDLVGYGLVVGLQGTGDGLRNSPFTEDILLQTLERLGVNVIGENVRAKNVAAVIVTAKLPPFSKKGSKFDISVSAIGDATSLRGGTLILTPLKAANGKIYAVAQGSIISSGAQAEGNAARVVEGSPTAGAVPFGATVEAEVDFEFSTSNTLTISLREADFSTIIQIEEAIDKILGRKLAHVINSRTISIPMKTSGYDSISHLVARLENIQVHPATSAKIIINQSSGTIVISKDVQVSNVAVSKGKLTLRVQETPLVSQPNPFSEGETVVVPRTEITIQDNQEVSLAEIKSAAKLSDVVMGLNALGVTTQDLIEILLAIKASGSLHAELETL